MLNSTLCYIEKDGKYLMLHRVKKENDVNKEKWIGIGGKFEDKESPEECILRETKEETGLTLNTIKLRAIVTFTSKEYETDYMYLFTSDDFSGKIIDCNEGNLEWIDKEELLKLNIWEGDKIFLNKIKQDCPFFTLKLEYDGDKLTNYTLNEY